jgi:hypothetical protein
MPVRRQTLLLALDTLILSGISAKWLRALEAPGSQAAIDLVLPS